MLCAFQMMGLCIAIIGVEHDLTIVLPSMELYYCYFLKMVSLSYNTFLPFLGENSPLQNEDQRCL